MRKKNEKLRGSFVDVYKIAWLDFQVLKFLQSNNTGQPDVKKKKQVPPSSIITEQQLQNAFSYTLRYFILFLPVYPWWTPENRMGIEQQMNV